MHDDAQCERVRRRCGISFPSTRTSSRTCFKRVNQAISDINNKPANKLFVEILSTTGTSIAAVAIVIKSPRPGIQAESKSTVGRIDRCGLARTCKMSDSDISFQHSDDDGSDFGIVASPAAGKKKTGAAAKPKKAMASKATPAAKGKAKATTTAAAKVGGRSPGIDSLLSRSTDVGFLTLTESHHSSCCQKGQRSAESQEECAKQLDVRHRRDQHSVRRRCRHGWKWQ